MGLFYKVSEKNLLELRNKIFLDKGIPALYNNDFERSPFSTSWFGKDDLQGYSYELCRLTSQNQIEIINAYIARGDSWIQLYLNIFELKPKCKQY